MQIADAVTADIPPAADCLATAFAQDPLTGYLFGAGPDHRERVTRFFSLLMAARVALGMPALIARDAKGIAGAVMGYTTAPPAWPDDIAAAWDRFVADVPGLDARLARYDAIAERCKPTVPHYYLGVIGADPARQGQGIGTQLIRAFCARSAADPASSGVYLETANPANVHFYERAGFEVTGRDALGKATLWCLFHAHARNAAPVIVPTGGVRA
jgi:ribosomal protein S18 acetylase RimI-like enzyme